MSNLLKTLAVLVIFSFAAGNVFAEKKAADTETKAKPAKVEAKKRPSARARRATTPADMMKKQMKMQEDKLAKAQKQHDEYIKKLNAIKQSALKEKAKNTPVMIEELIQEENKKFDKKKAKSEEQMKRFKENMEKFQNFKRQAPPSDKPKDIQDKGLKYRRARQESKQKEKAQ